MQIPRRAPLPAPALPGASTTPAETDVVIVGGGLAGAVFARVLAEAGMAVTCLEQGEWSSREDYRGRHDDTEIAALGPWHAHPNRRGRKQDLLVDDTDAEMKPQFFNGVGGSTILYGGHWVRFLPSDFRVRSLDGVADDWPVDWFELEPWYDQADRDFGASGLAGDPAYPPRSSDYPMPPLPIAPWGEKVAHAHHRLGWHWWPGANSIASRPYEGRRACVQRSTCGTGCNEGAKASVDITHWPRAIAAGAQLLTGARACEITLDGRGRANGVVYARDGERHRIGANIVVLAANAIGTARLLLLSASGREPHGMANRSSLVGRRLMMHPFARVIGFFDEPMESWQGHWGQSLTCMEFAESEPSRGFLRGAKWNLTPSGGPLAAALFPWKDAPRWGVPLHVHMAEWLGRTAIWGISCEDLPDPANRVALHPTMTDSDGLPAVSLHYSIPDDCRRMLAFNTARAAESLRAAGAYRTETVCPVTDLGWHLLGTARMGDDPETSVVNRWNRAHDVENLMIVDGSTFVTGSSVNPAATTAALALRAAHALVAARRDVRASA
ncbi:MAG: GMC family oxidoreductase [Alsobacter sp.]